MLELLRAVPRPTGPGAAGAGAHRPGRRRRSAPRRRTLDDSAPVSPILAHGQSVRSGVRVQAIEQRRRPSDCSPTVCSRSSCPTSRAVRTPTPWRSCAGARTRCRPRCGSASCWSAPVSALGPACGGHRPHHAVPAGLPAAVARRAAAHGALARRSPTSGRRGRTRHRPAVRPAMTRADVLHRRRPHHDCEVLVVGSGAGGATTAALLAEAGLDVLIVEEGRVGRAGRRRAVLARADGSPVPSRRRHRRPRTAIDRVHRGVLRRRRDGDQQRPLPAPVGGDVDAVAAARRRSSISTTHEFFATCDEIEQALSVQTVPGRYIGGEYPAARRRRIARAGGTTRSRAG